MTDHGIALLDRLIMIFFMVAYSCVLKQ